MSFNAVSKSCECKKGFYLDGDKCKSCPRFCQECSFGGKCEKCEFANYEFNNRTGQCEKNCEEGQVRVGQYCQLCPSLCLECDEGLKCIRCKKFSIAVDQTCKCKKGYFDSGGECKRKFFYFSVRSLEGFRFNLRFTEPVKNNLERKDFKVKIDKVQDFSFTVIKRSSKDYILSFELKESIINNTKATIFIIEKLIKSTNSSILGNYKETIYLREFKYFDHHRITTFLSDKVKLLSQILVTLSFFTIFFTNPSGLWAVINSINIITYLPIAENNLPNIIISICTSIGDYNYIPNTVAYIFSNRASSPPKDSIKKAGIETSVFWINLGQSLTPFLASLVLFPIIKFSSCLTSGKLQEKLKEYLKNYRYSLFIRFLIESYLDFLFFAQIQISSKIIEAASGYFNLISAFIFMVSFK